MGGEGWGDGAAGAAGSGAPLLPVPLPPGNAPASSPCFAKAALTSSTVSGAAPPAGRGKTVDGGGAGRGE